ncbi:MAG: permease [Ignavibacteria bacterium]|nr:permease [Ignavibacteria bacterium]
MNWKEQFKSFLWILGVFLFAYFMPIENITFRNAILEGFVLLKWYAREHVLLCLVPAFFIAGVISVFISQNSIIKYFGAKAKKWVAYTVASVSGSILAVCSCTILPLFSGIYKKGAGLGPAIAFLYSGPAINILAIILTARVLGLEIGIARVIGAVSFSILIGLIMAFIYRKEEKDKEEKQFNIPDVPEKRPLWQTVYHFFLLVAILVFVNWGKPDTESGFWFFIYSNKYYITGLLGLLLIPLFMFVLNLNKLFVLISTVIVIATAIIFHNHPLVPFTSAVILISILLLISKGEANEWLVESWGFAKQIMPLLAVGVLIAGFLLGSPESSNNGIIPNKWIQNLVGGNSLFSNFFASITGAFMYFATLTEIPILQGLINSGMGKGPALALLLAGPALSLPNMLVIKSVIGLQKTIVYVSLVIIMATITGLIYGSIF